MPEASNRGANRAARKILTAAPIVLAAIAALSVPVSASGAVSLGERYVPVRGHFPREVYRARIAGRVDTQEPVSLALSLPLRNQGELSSLLTRLYDPNSPDYGHFLTTREFTSRFSPTESEYNAVIAFARSRGLSVVATHPNRLVLDVQGPASVVENAFRLHLLRYQAPTGRLFRAPDTEPSVPESLAGVISGVVGLDTAAVWHPASVQLNANSSFDPLTSLQPFQTGTGPGGALTPSNIRTAYNLSSVAENGAGQTLALFELDGYKPSDISAYESYFSLPSVPLQNVLVDGYSGAAGSGAGEVTLDIELMVALAPGASKVIVYEGPNSGTGVVDTYNRIASDNLARNISTSWGLSEGSSTSSMLNAESSAFQQMAAQGQSIYAAAGDSGAYDNGSTLSVDDPASQPYMVGVGGTKLSTNGAGGAWLSETTWNNGSAKNGAGGGGISTVWSIPSWQSGVVSSASKGSSSMRNVPDVSLDGDPNSGYSIYYNGSWNIYGGTSCAAPLWAAFTALVNQRRAASGSGALGFANPALYNIGKGSRYTTDFHDINDGSTNLYYPAVTGFDDATGWGTFNGANLLSDLAPTGTTTTVPAAPTGLSASAGNGQVSLAWNTSTGAATYNVYRGTSSNGESSTPIASGLTGTTYTNTGLSNGTTYYYKVAAVNSAGTSGYSNEASATPTAPTTTGTAVKVVFKTQPVGGAAGQALTTQPVVAAVDANGNTVTSYTGAITVGLEVGTGTSGATLNGTRTINAVNGVAAYTNLSVSTAGTGYLMYAASSGLTATDSARFNVSSGTTTSGPATTAVFRTQPVGGAAGQLLSTQPVVAAVDANGNVDTSFNGSMTVGLEVGTGTAGATLNGTRTINAVNGIATFNNLSVSLAGTGYLMYVASSGLTATDSARFNVSASSGGTATMVVFATQPVGGVAGQPLTTQPVVKAVDANGNTVTSFNGAITVGLEVGTGTAGAVLNGTRTINAVNGVANFSGLSVNLAGTGYLMYAASSGLTATDSARFNVN